MRFRHTPVFQSADYHSEADLRLDPGKVKNRLIGGETY